MNFKEKAKELRKQASMLRDAANWIHTKTASLDEEYALSAQIYYELKFNEILKEMAGEQDYGY